MATLPIGYRDIITPYNPFAEEKAFITSSANNRAYVARAGGFRYSLNKYKTFYFIETK